jgi:hypothetical protein
MNNKIIFTISAIMIFAFALAIIPSASAYDYLIGDDLYPTYRYYDDSAKYNNIPTVAGPFPRGYLWNWNADNGNNVDFLYDDFNHYDDFIGYKDVDVFDLTTGTTEVIRSENSRPLDTSQVVSGYQTFGDHVYGFMPGPNGDCMMYRKHYNHEHPWELEIQEYNYGYFTPFLAYKKTPVTCPSCQQRSICELTHNC